MPDDHLTALCRLLGRVATETNKQKTAEELEDADWLARAHQVISEKLKHDRWKIFHFHLNCLLDLGPSITESFDELAKKVVHELISGAKARSEALRLVMEHHNSNTPMN